MGLSFLIVEDSSRKIERIRDLVTRIIPDIEARFDVAGDAATAAAFLRANTYDLMVLDVSLPLRPGAPAKSEGGIEVLRSIRERKSYHRPHHIVGLSEYPDLVEKYEEDFSKEMWYLISYAENSDEWAEKLGRKLIHIADILSPPPVGDYGVDIAIITALHKIELEAVLNLPGNWSRKEYEGDSTFYHEGSFTRDERTMTVVAAAAAQVGMPAATALAMKMISRCHPKYLAMLGISAGVKGNFGDVLIADQAWDYGSGKQLSKTAIASAFHPAPIAIPLAPNLKSRFEVFGLNHRVLLDLAKNWTGNENTGGPLQAIIGPVASGAAVVAHRPIIDELVTRNAKLVGIEMETYGVFLAAQQCPEPRPQAMSLKSICDFGSKEKGDEFQRYAAYTSAQYFYEFALKELPV